MTVRTPGEIRSKFGRLRRDCDPRGHELLQELERLALHDNAMLAMRERIDNATETIYADTYSRRVPDTPALRLAGQWEADARSVSLPDVGGLTLGDPRIDTLRDEGAL